MKVKIKEKKIKKFAPIELVLTIENKEDLCNIFKRFDIMAHIINDHHGVNTQHDAIDNTSLAYKLKNIMNTKNLIN